MGNPGVPRLISTTPDMQIRRDGPTYANRANAHTRRLRARKGATLKKKRNRGPPKTGSGPERVSVPPPPFSFSLSVSLVLLVHVHEYKRALRYISSTPDNISAPSLVLCFMDRALYYSRERGARGGRGEVEDSCAR